MRVYQPCSCQRLADIDTLRQPHCAVPLTRDPPDVYATTTHSRRTVPRARSSSTYLRRRLRRVEARAAIANSGCSQHDPNYTDNAQIGNRDVNDGGFARRTGSERGGNAPRLRRPRLHHATLPVVCRKGGIVKRLQAGTAAELDALLPAILDRAFKGEL